MRWALRLDEGQLHTPTSTLNPHPQHPYGPPLLEGDRLGPESAIGLSESVVGIVGTETGLERDKAVVLVVNGGRSVSSFQGQQLSLPAGRAWQGRVWPWRSTGGQG